MTETIREARVAQYGILPPVEGGKVVRDQMRSTARYYNDLIALERTRRAVYRDLRSQFADMAPIEDRATRLASELSGLRDAIKAARKDARRRVETRELDDRAKSVYVELKAARDALKLARAAARDDVELQGAVRELDARALVWAKALRATTDSYWGSYLLAEASIEQARKATVDPTFRRARGRERIAREWQSSAEGRIGVQIQGGMSVAELLGGEDTRLRLVDAPESYRGRRTSARGLRRCATKLLYVRVGSEGRAPVWAVFPLILHRSIPSEATIKGATVSLRVEGMRELWTANLTYVREAVPMPQHAGVVALDLGWRKRPDASLRVAYWADDQGGHGEILMPPLIRDQLRRARDLREIQDRHFNRAVRWLQRWLSVADGDALPLWLARERTTLGQWRSHARLRDLVLRWRDARFGGDRRIYEALERWMHRSRHLVQYEDGARSNALRARREVYRMAAVQIARQYGAVVIEDFDLNKAKRLHAPEQEADAPRAQRAQLHASAPGELRQAITQAVRRDGGVIVSLSAIGTTSHCHACGGICEWDQADEISHVCEHCGAAWDQDHNAAVNLLGAFTRERLGDAKNAVVARETSKRSKRFAKRGAASTREGLAAE